MSDLYGRLKQIREQQRRRGETAGPSDVGSTSPVSTSGISRDTAYLNPGTDWREEAPGVFLRRTHHPLDVAEDIAPDGTWGPLSPLLRVGDTGRILAMDIETTGLSGGAGNVAFLVGVAGIGAGTVPEIVLDQLFLGDFDAEPSFLEALEALLIRESGAGPPIYVTYNGSRFDLPVLRSRFLLNRCCFPEAIHLDALHLTRRLYARTIGSCTLTNVEERVLAHHREYDIPGAEVPERYLEYLRLRRIEQLAAVVSHHEADIVNLVHLARLLNQTLTAASGGTVFPPPEGTTVAPDAIALARLLLERGGEPWAARSLLLDLREATEHRRRERISGATGSLAQRRASQIPRDWVTTRLDLIRLVRREGDFELMRDLLEEMLAVRGTISDAEELAKYWEHRKRDPARALRILLDHRAEHGDWPPSAHHRAARLKRKRDARSSRR